MIDFERIRFVKLIRFDWETTIKIKFLNALSFYPRFLFRVRMFVVLYLSRKESKL